MNKFEFTDDCPNRECEMPIDFEMGENAHCPSCGKTWETDSELMSGEGYGFVAWILDNEIKDV